MPTHRLDPRRSVAMVAAVMIAIAVAPALAAPSAKKGDPKGAVTATKPDPAQEALMAEMIRLASPGAAHEKLRPLEGKFKATQKSWFAPGEPTVSEGVSENRLILGGRYLEQHYRGTAMGQPFEGQGLIGYDNKKGEYTMVWVDNMSTWIMSGAGAMEGSDLTIKAMAPGPDGQPMEYKMVTRVVDGNRHVFSTYGTVNGQEQLMMEITYTRM